MPMLLELCGLSRGAGGAEEGEIRSDVTSFYFSGVESLHRYECTLFTPLTAARLASILHTRYFYHLFISQFQIVKLESGVADVIERYRYDPFRNRLIFNDFNRIASYDLITARYNDPRIRALGIVMRWKKK